MAAEQTTEQVTVPSPTCMESVNRISKLPVVESTIQTATSIYEKVKVSENFIQFCISVIGSSKFIPLLKVVPEM